MQIISNTVNNNFNIGDLLIYNGPKPNKYFKAFYYETTGKIIYNAISPLPKLYGTKLINQGQIFLITDILSETNFVFNDFNIIYTFYFLFENKKLFHSTFNVNNYFLNCFEKIG